MISLHVNRTSPPSIPPMQFYESAQILLTGTIRVLGDGGWALVTVNFTLCGVLYGWLTAMCCSGECLASSSLRTREALRLKKRWLKSCPKSSRSQETSAAQRHRLHAAD